MARGVGGAEDLELRLGALGGREADGDGAVVEVGDARGGGEDGEAVVVGLRVLVVEGVAVLCVEVLV